MAQSVGSGALGYVNYGFEASEGTVAASFPKNFGHGMKISVVRKNNMERVHSLGSRNATANVAKKFEGTATVEFDLSANSSWFRGVMGALPTDAGGGPYTHSFAESNTLLSFSIAAAQELGTNDSVAALIGCKVASATISAAVGEIAKVRLECPYRTETMATTGIGSVVAAGEEPLHFANGTLSVAGTTVGYVQSVELTINHNLEMVWGLGSRYSTASVPKSRTYDLKMTVMFSDVTLLLEKFYGKSLPVAATDLASLNPAGVACILTFDNGGATTASRKVVVTFANLFLDTHTLPFDVNEVTKEDVGGWALSCTSIVVTNNTATDVAVP
jgi:hypothetical protein